MSIIEQATQRNAEKQKAMAYDNMIAKAEADKVREIAYNEGLAGRAAELNALQAEAQKQMYSDPRYQYSAPDYKIGDYTGRSALDNAINSDVAVLPSPRDGLAERYAR